MIIHNSADVKIYFGDASDGISFQDYHNALTHNGSFTPSRYEHLKQSFGLKECIFLRQTHGIDGVVITHSTRDIKPFAHEGDFLITNQPDIGLAVLTADCLPIILYDPTKKVIALAHAGLKGSHAKITSSVIESMKKRFNCHPKQIHAFFGPSAKWCCYQIGEDIADDLKKDKNSQRYVIERHNAYFLDLAQFNAVQLEQLGLHTSTFCFDYNVCTICNSRFNSYRRQHQSAGRQITLVHLR